MSTRKNALSADQKEALLKSLKTRFEKNTSRHKGLDWNKVQEKLEANPAKLWSLNEMERTEGEPDVVAYNAKTGEYIFYDCSAESPKGRRSFCYDREAWEARKQHKPENTAIDIEKEIFRIIRKELKIPSYLTKADMPHTGGHAETMDADLITLLELEKIIKKVIKGYH
jgi:hypothetical protein